MAGIFLKIVNMSISASWIVLAVVVLRLLLKKAPKWLNGVLWAIVGLRLLMPFSLESAFSLIPSSQTIYKAPSAPRPYFDSGVAPLDSRVNAYLKSYYFEGVTRPAGHFVDITTILAIVWAVGVVALLAYAAVSYLRLRKKVGAAVLLRDNIYQSENVASPFVLGVFQPRIFLPFRLAQQEMGYVIAHEKAHILRRDHLWKPIGFLLLALHWFNPLMWLGYVLLCRDIELACDEKVIKDLASEEKADYSQALLNCSVSRSVIAACPLAFGEVSVKNRVKSVLHYKKPAFWVILVAILACVAAAVCFLTDPASGNLSSMEDLAIGQVLENAEKVLTSENGETYYYTDKADADILQKLGDLEILKKPVSDNRGTDRDASHTVVIQTDRDLQPATASHFTGLYVYFSADFSQVWARDEEQTTLSYPVKDPALAKELYYSIAWKQNTAQDTENSTKPLEDDPLVKTFRENMAQENVTVVDYVYAKDEAYGLTGVVEYWDSSEQPWKLAFVCGDSVFPTAIELDNVSIVIGGFQYRGNGTVQTKVIRTGEDEGLYRYTMSFSRFEGGINFQAESEKLANSVKGTIEPGDPGKIYPATMLDKVSEKLAREEMLILYGHYQTVDGKWCCGDYVYDYRLELTGRMPNAAKNSTFIVLSNDKSITFAQTWPASGYSSNIDAYFDPADAIIVGHRLFS